MARPLPLGPSLALSGRFWLLQPLKLEQMDAVTAFLNPKRSLWSSLRALLLLGRRIWFADFVAASTVSSSHLATGINFLMAASSSWALCRAMPTIASTPCMLKTPRAPSICGDQPQQDRALQAVQGDRHGRSGPVSQSPDYHGPPQPSPVALSEALSPEDACQFWHGQLQTSQDTNGDLHSLDQGHGARRGEAHPTGVLLAASSMAYLALGLILQPPWAV
ncbi:hypothetical protein PhCBS80983_g06388 [Powellomyces hirtus]|uniref:Uncharacterized protein n=1 Tax=Powellomyces hirtus TaxID=109895 RepID=A0A507DQ21_9FUNG|nr:hypothetical protein PhCBS80983_g06388 [Powellomyces hirtus]